MEVEVAIVGAGAAGIAAARRLHNRGHRTLLIEALDRVGGRAHTAIVEGLPLDLGCGWLHSAERNPLARLAETEGKPLDRSEAAWGRQLRNLGFAADEQEEAWTTYAAFERRLHDDPLPDDIAGDAIAKDHRWRGYLDMISGALNGAELDCVSARDLLAYDDHASESNWRLPTGMGAFIAGMTEDLSVALNLRAERIDTGGRQIRIETNKGSIRADAAIVAVPTDVLAAGAIGLPTDADEHIHAAACLPLGRVDKLFLKLPHPEAVPAESHLVGNPHDALTGSYYLRPFGYPVVECFFGGIAARAMEEAGSDGRLAFARQELGGLLGNDFARGLKPLAGSWWHKVPSIGGAYSHALPGHSDKRAVLAQPVGERLFFAGEACSLHDFSTAHGAWASGVAAAEGVAAALARR